MTLTVDEILAAPRADRMRLIRENVDHLSGEDINKITTSLLQGINANLKKSVLEVSAAETNDVPRARLQEQARSAAKSAPKAATEAPVEAPTPPAAVASPVATQPAIEEQSAAQSEDAAIATAEAELTADLASADEVSDVDYAAIVSPQPEVALLPPPSEAELETDGEGYETVALVMPDQPFDPEPAEAADGISEDIQVAEAPESDQPADDLSSQVSEAEFAPAQENTAPEEDEGDDTPLGDEVPLDFEMDLESEAEALEAQEETLEPPVASEAPKAPLVLSPATRVDEAASSEIPKLSAPTRAAAIPHSFPELADEEGDDEIQETRPNLVERVKLGVLAMLPLPTAGAAAYYGSGPAADLINAAPRFDIVIGVVILLNVCWMLCELTGVAFRRNMVVAARLAFIISLYYPLDVVNRYLAGQSIDTLSLIYLIVPAAIGLTDLWLARKK